MKGLHFRRMGLTAGSRCHSVADTVLLGWPRSLAGRGYFFLGSFSVSSFHAGIASAEHAGEVFEEWEAQSSP